MADNLYIELVTGSSGAGTVVKFTNDDWASATQLTEGYAKPKLLALNATKRKAAQVAFIEAYGKAKATVRLYAVRNKKEFSSKKPQAGVPGLQRLIGVITVNNGVVVFRDPGTRKRLTRFRESLPPRKRGTVAKTHDHSPQQKGKNGDSRRFKVGKTKMSLANTTAGNRRLIPTSGIILTHGEHNITFSPGATA